MVELNKHAKLFDLERDVGPANTRRQGNAPVELLKPAEQANIQNVLETRLYGLKLRTDGKSDYAMQFA